jgi:hypothetical protein
MPGPNATKGPGVGYVQTMEPSVRRFGEGEDPAPEGGVPEPGSDGPSQSAEPAGTGGLRKAAVELAAGIDEILVTAADKAEEIQREARESAQRYLEQRRREADQEHERRVREASRDLQAPVLEVTRACASLREQAELVVEAAAALERAAAESLGSLGAQEEGPLHADAPFERATAETVTPAGEDQGDVPARPREEAILRAAQLAVAGRPRVEIEEIVRAEFGIAGPDEVVKEILGDR